MRVEVLNTGSELLLGQVVNAHLSYLAERLFELDLRIERQVCVPDGPPIRDALADAFERCEVVLVTGGLGPTSDDVTREIAAELCGMELRLHEESLRRIERMFAERGSVMKPENRRQAMVPAGGEVIPNDWGTAPGLYLPAATGRPHLFLLPGPPRELKPMFETLVMPMLKTLAGTREERLCRNYKIFGVGESSVAARLESELTSIDGLEHGYCARPGEVDLRCIATAEVLASVNGLVQEAFGDELVSTDNASLEETVVKLLASRAETLALAESCTGGHLADLVTNVPGASDVFIQSVVTYANEAKTRLLGVNAELIARHGAVSEEVAGAMAAGCRERAGATHALAVTGIAGPGGGSREKPVGTAFIGMQSAGRPVLVSKVYYPTDRLTFKSIVAHMALDLLRRRLRGRPLKE